MQGAPPRPQGVVEQEGESWRPVLRFRSEPLPLGLHSQREVAESAYDAALIRMALDMGKPASQPASLHRPAASYTQHLLWQHLLPPCSLEAACRLLAGGLAAGFLAPAHEAAAHLHAAQASAAPSAAAAAAAMGQSPADTPATAGPAAPSTSGAADPAATGAGEPPGDPQVPAATPAPGEQLAGSTPSTTAQRSASAGSGGAQAAGNGPAQHLAAKPRWLEFPPGSVRFATALSPKVASTGALSLPLWMTAAGFPAIGRQPDGVLLLQPAGGSGTPAPEAAGEMWQCKWSTNSKGDGLRRVLRLAKGLLASEKLAAGDVFVLNGSTSRRTSYRIWRAGSADAQCFAAFEHEQPYVGGQVKRDARGVSGGKGGSGGRFKRARRASEGQAAVQEDDAGDETESDDETESETEGVEAQPTDQPTDQPNSLLRPDPSAQRGSSALFPLHDKAALNAAAAGAPSRETAAAAAGVQQAQPRGAHGVYASCWQEPHADGCVLTLTDNTARLTRGNRIRLPVQHAQAIFGQAPPAEMQPTAVTLVTPNGRQHSCFLGRDTRSKPELKGAGVGDMMHTLAGAAGDQLLFRAAGFKQARVALVTGREQAQHDGQVQQQQQQRQQLAEEDLPQGTSASPSAASAAMETVMAAMTRAGTAPGDGPLPEVGSLVHSEEGLWAAIGQLFRRMEAQGHAPAAHMGPYIASLASTASHRWRLSHYCILRAFAERGAWEQVAAWVQLASKQGTP